MKQFPEALAAFKREHPNLRVTAIATHREYSERAGELIPRGYIVNTEGK